LNILVKICTLFVTHFWTFLAAFGMTVRVTVLSLIFATIIGIVVALIRLVGPKPLKAVGNVYISIIRGTPLMVQILFIYFGIPSALHVHLTLFAASVLTMSLNGGAYMAEIIRGGIEAVDKGQMEASRSLGLSYGQTMRLVILPQALRMMLPSIINQFIVTLKDTSLLSAIGLRELTQNTKIIVANNMEALTMYFICGVWYWVVIFILTRVSRLVEKRTQYGR